jgi:hypothetical protein
MSTLARSSAALRNWAAPADETIGAEEGVCGRCIAAKRSRE